MPICADMMIRGLGYMGSADPVCGELGMLLAMIKIDDSIKFGSPAESPGLTAALDDAAKPIPPIMKDA